MRALRLVALWVAMLTPSSVWACPLCESETGRQVRASILGSDFGYNLLVTVLPFAVLAVLVALLHFGGRVDRQQP